MSETGPGRPPTAEAGLETNGEAAVILIEGDRERTRTARMIDGRSRVHDVLETAARRRW